MNSYDQLSDNLCHSSWNKYLDFYTSVSSSALGHQRLGHPSSKIMSYVLKQTSLVCSPSYGLCSSCFVGKSTNLPFFACSTLYTSPLQLVKVDL